MKLYHVTTDTGFCLPVFEHTPERATASFITWTRNQRETEPLPGFEVKEVRAAPHGTSADHLGGALSKGVTGVGYYDDATGWIILAPNYCGGEAGS